MSSGVLILLSTLDYLGTIVFAMTGALKGVRREMDMFGVASLAVVTAIGGGTLRDLLLQRPVFWMVQPVYILIAVVTALFVFLLYRAVSEGEGLIMTLDAIGLGVFTAIGAMRAQEAGAQVVIIVTMACLTGIGGGLIRDLLSNDIPVVLRKEVYASACIAGALAFWGVQYFHGSKIIAIVVAAGLTITIRILAMIYNWNFPRVKITDETEPENV